MMVVLLKGNLKILMTDFNKNHINTELKKPPKGGFFLCYNRVIILQEFLFPVLPGSPPEHFLEYNSP